MLEMKGLIEMASYFSNILQFVAPVCNPTLQIIEVQIPCMEKPEVAVGGSNYF